MKGKFILILLALTLRVFAAASLRFVAMDVFLDPKGEPLAAYQLEITADPGTKIVGIEGGEHPEFRKAPYYDPKAIQSERAIIAAFSAAPAGKLPTGKTRIITLHLQTTGVPKLESVLKILARPDTQKIPAEISLVERKEQ